MSDANLWWVFTGISVVIDLIAGTFYLLMIALGTTAAAMAALAGFSMQAQMLVAALIGGGFVVIWHMYRRKYSSKTNAQSDPNVLLDIGETVQVLEWRADGSAKVSYRGALWSANLKQGAIRETGAHKVVEMVGSSLLLEKIQEEK